MDYSSILNDIYIESKALPVIGTITTIIPELASVSPDKYGIYLTTIDNQNFGIGDFEEKFSIQHARTQATTNRHRSNRHKTVSKKRVCDQTGR